MSMKVRMVSFLSLLAVLSAGAVEQVDEAKAVFDGVAVDKMRGGTWKVVYGSSEGPEGRALEVLSERLGNYLLREYRLSPQLALPFEKAGGEPVTGKRDRLLVGRLADNPELAKYVSAADVPKGGYLVRTRHEADGRNVVVLAGDTPSAVLWATFELLDIVAPQLEQELASPPARYAGLLFRVAKVPDFDYATAPETPVRSVFSWGFVVDDFRTTFRAMARARFNRVILWNNTPVINAREVVDCAHSWGIEVYWGCSWGWTLSGTDREDVNFSRIAADVVDDWRTKWRPMGGDGIYLQSFTETRKTKIAGRSIAEAAVELVNRAAGGIRSESPGLDIVFGLHADSVTNDVAARALVQVSPDIEILWENCGKFPYGETDGVTNAPNMALHDRIAAISPNYGLAWKAQLRMDWAHATLPVGPIVLGCAGARLLARDRAVTSAVQWAYDEDWIVNGAGALELAQYLRKSGRAPQEFNAVAEYNPPYSFSTLCSAEIFWNSSADWPTIERRARMRARPER